MDQRDGVVLDELQLCKGDEKIDGSIGRKHPNIVHYGQIK